MSKRNRRCHSATCVRLCACKMGKAQQAGFGLISSRMMKSRATDLSDLSTRNSRPNMAQSQHLLGRARCTSGLIPSDDSQIDRGSSSSRHERRNCGERHENGSPSA
jgi:hypothetical protein